MDDFVVLRRVKAAKRDHFHRTLLVTVFIGVFEPRCSPMRGDLAEPFDAGVF